MTGPPLAGARVLVLGASGFIGSRVCRAAAHGGAHVTAAARDPAALAQSLRRLNVSADVVAADFTAPESGSALVEQVRPGCVLNLVGYGVDRDERDAALAERLNGQLVGELVQALIRHESRLPAWQGPRLVHLGSAFEYGSAPGLISEDTPCRPETSYGRSKLQGTRLLSELCAQSGLPAVALRIATVYGPGEHPHRLLPTLLRAARTGEEVPLTPGEQVRDFTYVDDVAQGVLRIAGAVGAPYSVVNLATGHSNTVRDFVSRARKMLEIPPERIIFGALPYRDDEVWQGPLDVSRLRTLLDWAPPTGIDAGVRKTIEWSRATGD